ncbi:MAG: ABC transporter permease, partial [Rhodospirillales bacterium]|nr:ABC transporter permease [Rhodospirillales bacterium]
MTVSSEALSPPAPVLQVSLKAKLQRTQRKRKLVAFLLVAPLFLFIIVNFLVPIGILLFKAVDNPEIVEGLPRTVAAIRQWDGRDLPAEAVYEALAQDLHALKDDRGALGRLAKRLNY